MPFRAMFTEMFESDEEYRPIAGDTVKVTFDGDHKVKFDRDVLYKHAQALKAADRTDFASIAGQPVGTPTPDTAAVPPDDPRIGILEVSLRQAQRRGDVAELQRLTAQLADLQRDQQPGG